MTTFNQVPAPPALGPTNPATTQPAPNPRVFVYTAEAPKVHSVKYNTLDPEAPFTSVYLRRGFFPGNAMPGKNAITVTAQ